MDAADVLVAKDDETEIIRASEIAAVNLDYDGNVTARLAGGDAAPVTLAAERVMMSTGPAIFTVNCSGLSPSCPIPPVLTWCGPCMMSHADGCGSASRCRDQPAPAPPKRYGCGLPGSPSRRRAVQATALLRHRDQRQRWVGSLVTTASAAAGAVAAPASRAR